MEKTIGNDHNRITGDGFQFEDALREIQTNMHNAQMHYIQICDQMDQLVAAGMYPSIPTVSMEARNGSDNIYMRLRWKQDTRGTYLSPNGSASTYIGNDPAKQAEARRLIENRRRWEYLDDVRQKLRRWLQLQATDLRRIASFGEHHPRVKYLSSHCPVPEDSHAEHA